MMTRLISAINIEEKIETVAHTARECGFGLRHGYREYLRSLDMAYMSQVELDVLDWLNEKLAKRTRSTCHVEGTPRFVHVIEAAPEFKKDLMDRHVAGMTPDEQADAYEALLRRENLSANRAEFS